MAINQHHTVEELNGVRCAVVEKNVSPERAVFLKKLLEHNGYQVEIAKPAPKAPPKPAASASSAAQPAPAIPPPPAEPASPQAETFTIGVTDLTYNTINAIFGRLLRTPEDRIVTLAYWEQQDAVSREAVPYFYKK